MAAFDEEEDFSEETSEGEDEIEELADSDDSF